MQSSSGMRIAEGSPSSDGSSADVSALARANADDVKNLQEIHSSLRSEFDADHKRVGDLRESMRCLWMIVIILISVLSAVVIVLLLHVFSLFSSVAFEHGDDPSKLAVGQVCHSEQENRIERIPLPLCSSLCSSRRLLVAKQDSSLQKLVELTLQEDPSLFVDVSICRCPDWSDSPPERPPLVVLLPDTSKLWVSSERFLSQLCDRFEDDLHVVLVQLHASSCDCVNCRDEKSTKAKLNKNLRALRVVNVSRMFLDDGTPLDCSLHLVDLR